jgi:D-xylonolactonase
VRATRGFNLCDIRIPDWEDCVMELELIADYACVVGENPLWHPDEKRVYWVDIDTGRMFRYDPASGAHEQFYQGRTVGGFTIQEDGALLLFMDGGAIGLWRDGRVAMVVEGIPGEEDSRFNDVAADPAGRVFCGTMSSGAHAGRLYRLDTDGTVTPVVEDVACSNGIAFTPDRKHLYYTDSERYVIYRFDYDESTGAIANRQDFARSPQSEGLPDGMTVDAEACIWSARWDGSCLVRLSPTGAEMQRIPFPVKKVSSVTFGGDGTSDMYVTTAGGDKKPTDGEHAGALYRLRPGVRGLPEFRSRIRANP